MTPEQAKKNRENFNGVANLIMFAALVCATIIAVVAISMQPWLWWQCGLSICAIVFVWGMILAGVATSIRPSL